LEFLLRRFCFFGYRFIGSCFGAAADTGEFLLRRTAGIDKPIKVGQFVRLESGEEGYVDKIGWRSSWIRMLPNNTW